jgi:hypothetical protein
MRYFGAPSPRDARVNGRPWIAQEVRDLIRRMSLENPLWGATKIHGELGLARQITEAFPCRGRVSQAVDRGSGGEELGHLGLIAKQTRTYLKIV